MPSSETNLMNADDKETRHAGSSDTLKRWGPLALLLAGIATVYLTGAHKYLSLSAIAENRMALQEFVTANYILAVGSYMMVYVLATAFSVPGGVILTILGGFLFGWMAGGTFTVIAATIGATAVFLVAQSSFGDVLSRKAGKFVQKLADGFKKDSFNYLLFLRLVPVFPFWLVNIAPALFKVPLRTYITATFLGIIPGTFAFCIVGSGLDSIILAQREAYNACIAEKGAQACEFKLNASALITPELVAGFVALGVIALIPVVVRRFKERKSPQS